MRKRNYVEAMPGTLTREISRADHFFSNFAQSMNCVIASRPTGTIRRGRRISISLSIQEAQLRIFVGSRKRDLCRQNFFSGKTAADRCEINF